MYTPPRNVITATARVATDATGVKAPNDVNSKIIAIVKYVQGSMIFNSFLIYVLEQQFRTNVLL